MKKKHQFLELVSPLYSSRLKLVEVAFTYLAFVTYLESEWCAVAMCQLKNIYLWMDFKKQNHQKQGGISNSIWIFFFNQIGPKLKKWEPKSQTSSFETTL
jgi:hypothetical protein